MKCNSQREREKQTISHSLNVEVKNIKKDTQKRTTIRIDHKNNNKTKKYFEAEEQRMIFLLQYLRT